MVYAGTTKGERATLGVSGRLLKSNLVMWDEETDSLWSQILGTALHGERKGARLKMWPAVFVGFSTWVKLHPDTLVLDLEPVPRRAWHFTTEDLARGRVGERTLAIGLRHGEDTVAIPLERLHTDELVTTRVDGIPIAVVWLAGENAALAYVARDGTAALDLSLDRGRLTARGLGARTWDALSGRGLAPEGLAPLERFPYIPTYLEAWRTYYPKGRVLAAR